uniref:F-box domain-containing protein n=1 Tax=Strongyloides papillosus TaxID=174720 RepID=A0A0N5BUW3_STREA
MDKPAIDLLSLPDNFKLQILKKLDWTSLVKLKYVCRDLYFLIERNIRVLESPKVCSMKIYYIENEISGAYYRLMNTEGPRRYGSLKHVKFSNGEEYENFLKRIDFTGIELFELGNLSNTEYIFVRYEDDSDKDFSTYTLSGRSQTGRFRYSYLSIVIKRSRKFGILYDSNILRKESLRKLGFFGNNRLRLVGKKIAMDLLTDNPMLEYENTPTVICKPLHVQIVNHLFELGLFNPENTCGRKGFTLVFHGLSKFGVLRERFYRKLFDKTKLNNNLVEENNDDVFSIKSSMNCSKCRVKHENSMIYYKNSKELSIMLH